MSSQPTIAAIAPDAAERRGAALRASIAAGVVLAGVVGARLLVAVPFPTCAFRVLTGLPCPGCGMTRSLVCLSHGDAAGSFRLHPLGVAIAAFGLAVLGGAVVGALTGRDPVWRAVAPRGAHLALGFVATLVAVWILRTFVVPSWAPAFTGYGDAVR